MVVESTSWADRLTSLSPALSVGILSADLLSLGTEIRLLERVGVPLVHIDVMDGCFCPMLTAGPPLVKALRTPLLKDVHLMIADPHRRVILRRADQPPGNTPELRIEVPDAATTMDAWRQSIGQAIAEHTVRHGAKPQTLAIAGFGAWRIERPGPVSAEAPLLGKTALVTGAAGAIGAGICRGLLENGCRVMATDLMQAPLTALTGELEAVAPNRIAGVRMDVTDKASVAEGFARTVEQWGGVDLVVVNAGIATVAPLMELDLDVFRKLEQVNVEGTLLTLAEAGRCLCRQGTGGDIVLVSTKNVFAPGAQFGAYSATKAASHQLGRIASLELAPFDIRVNMVAPDAVFGDGGRKSGLWAEVGPSRMRARGLDEQGLEEYYRGRNLLKARVTPAHVAKAVLFFATRQTPTTGATIPVDGGLPDATPR